MTVHPAQDVVTIRPFRHEDAPAVAQLFQSLMRGVDAAPSEDLAAYFTAHFLDGPFADPQCPSLVHVSDSGEIDGFGGRVVQPLAFAGRTLRAAIVGTLMVRDHARSPMAGARLLKALKDGPQDVTLSETAGDASLTMWRQLRGAVLDRHSLDFTRVLKPVRYGIELLATRIGAARLLLPLAGLLDGVLASKPGPLRWTGLPKGFKPDRGVRSADTTPEVFGELFAQWSGLRRVTPLWPGDGLRHVIGEAMGKRDFGRPCLRVVSSAAGAPLGAFLFHFGGSGPVRVTEIIHAPGQAGPVLDALFADAQALRASSVRGRTTPQLLDALLSRRVLLTHEGASVIAAKDPEIIAAFQSGEAHMNGLVGERWTRLIGDSFAPEPVRDAVKPNGSFPVRTGPVPL